MEQPTRLIIRTTDPQSQQESSPKTSTPSSPTETAQRLASELAYITHYATAMGSLLGMNVFRFSVLDDREGQTTLMQIDGTWTGSISSTHRTINQAQSALISP